MSALSNYNNNSPYKTKSTKTFQKSCTTPNNRLSNKTPRGRKTPNADRFITNRDAMDFESSKCLFKEALSKEKTTVNTNNTNNNQTPNSPSTQEYNSCLRETLNANPEAKILAFKHKAPAPREGHLNTNRVLYTQNRISHKLSGGNRKTMRKIPQTADRILDAPELMDDYYLNLLSWSQSSNVLSVALGNSVYLWNADSGNITKLMSTTNTENYVSSVNWIEEGNVLAVGTNDKEVQLWDASELKCLRTMGGHSGRIGALAWNKHMLSSGSRSGQIHHHDVRIQNHLVANLEAHTQEVCGLQWSADGNQLASGGNDNILNIWDINNYDRPRFSIADHNAAVKAVAWCPWQNNLLASGGGTADRTIRFWNTNTGNCSNVIDTNSQVCSILWSKHNKELVSSHGFSQNQLAIWKYPSMTKITELTGHTSRVLHMALSPDGQTVVSAAGDETLRFWRCFAEDPTDRKPKSVTLTRTAPNHRQIR